MELRRKTAESLFAAIPNPAKGDADTLIALAEVISYANEGVYKKAFEAALEAYGKNPVDKHRVNKALSVLVRCGVVPNSVIIK